MVKLLKPTTLKDAISLAKMQEDTVQTLAIHIVPPAPAAIPKQPALLP